MCWIPVLWDSSASAELRGGGWTQINPGEEGECCFQAADAAAPNKHIAQ